MKKIFTLIAALGIVFTAQIAKADTYALMIGINDYPDVVDKDGKPILDSKTNNPINDDLAGCVNDIKDYNDVLVNKYGIKPDHIKTLLDKDAGEKGFLGGIDWLASNVKKGDQILFVYSGHGAQIEDKTEDDGFEECIVLADEMLVPGDFFHEMATSFTDAGINASFVFDSCFSGGISRDVFSYNGKPGTRRPKAVDKNATVRMKEVMPAELDKRVAKAKQSPVKVEKPAEYAFVFAGGEGQTTADLSFDDPSLPARGLFSLLFSAVLQDDPNISLVDAITEIKDILQKKQFDQVPGFDFSSPERGKLPLIEK